MTCSFVATNQPRIIKGRHDEDCAGETCAGCQPCTEAHCRVCSKEHAEGTCAPCLAEARDDLTAIGDMCHALPTEVRHKGVDSEAMALLAPAADAEAWGHMTTSLHVGRLPAGYLCCDRCDRPWPCEKHADSEQHPLMVLGTWDMVWRDALDHETDETLTIASAVAYLGEQMTHMAGFEDAPFEDFARDLRRCRSHLEAVLHDGEQRETGAPCVNCRVPLHKVWRGRELPWSSHENPSLASEDGWACPRCPHDRRWYTKAQYDNAVRGAHLDAAEWLTDADMAIRTAVKASTVRSWARSDSASPVRKRRNADRTVYSVEDVERVRDGKASSVA